jgi:retrotransposon gag protein
MPATLRSQSNNHQSFVAQSLLTNSGKPRSRTRSTSFPRSRKRSISFPLVHDNYVHHIQAQSLPTEMAEPEHLQAENQIPKFGGKINENAAKWLKQANSQFDSCVHDYPADKRVKKIPTKLVDDAFDWWDEYKQNIQTWADFETAIVAKYPPPTVVINIHLAGHELDSRRQQPGETVRSYVLEMLKLCDAYDKKMSDAIRVHKIIGGLRLDLVDEAIKSNFATPQALLTGLDNAETRAQIIQNRIIREQGTDASTPAQYPYEDNTAVSSVRPSNINRPSSFVPSQQTVRSPLGYQPRYVPQQSFGRPSRFAHTTAANQQYQQWGNPSANTFNSRAQLPYQQPRPHTYATQQRPRPQYTNSQQYGHRSQRTTQDTRGSYHNNRGCYECGALDHFARDCYRHLK